MKVRLGYVSNSSSSSFTCNVCGREGSGWDVSIYDIDMSQCINGHTFCNRHLPDEYKDEYGDLNITPGLQREYVKAKLEQDITKWKTESWAKEAKGVDGWIAEAEGKLVVLNNTDDDDIEDVFESELCEMRSEMLPNSCPVCTFQHLVDRDGFAYLLKRCNTTGDVVLTEMKTTFASYDEFKAYVK